MATKLSADSKIKKISYGHQWIDSSDIRSVTQALKSEYLTQGPLAREFESELCRLTGAKFAIAVSNGTAALHLAALCLDLKPQDEVITTPISFLATANAILYAGAKPVFADIDPDTQCIDPDEIIKKISKRTRAIFFTDFAGHPANLKKIKAIATKYKLKLVEDAAHALGSQYQGTQTGSCAFSDMTIFSFHPVKHITTGEGGAITTQDPQLAEKLRLLQNHGVTRDQEKLSRKNEGPWYYEMQALGFNYRLTDLQAALGLSQLKKLEKFIARRRQIAARYNRAFSQHSFLLTPVEQELSRHSYHLYIIRLTANHLIRNRKQIVEDFHNAGIGVQIHYIPIPMQPYYQSLGYQIADLPVAWDYYQKAISLPMYPSLKNKEIDTVIKTTNKILDRYLN